MIPSLSSLCPKNLPRNFCFINQNRTIRLKCRKKTNPKVKQIYTLEMDTAEYISGAVLKLQAICLCSCFAHFNAEDWEIPIYAGRCHFFFLSPTARWRALRMRVECVAGLHRRQPEEAVQWAAAFYPRLWDFQWGWGCAEQQSTLEWVTGGIAWSCL